MVTSPNAAPFLEGSGKSLVVVERSVVPARLVVLLVSGVWFVHIRGFVPEIL